MKNILIILGLAALAVGVFTSAAPSEARAEHGGPLLGPQERYALCLDTITANTPLTPPGVARIQIGNLQSGSEVYLIDFDMPALRATGLSVCTAEYLKHVGGGNLGPAASAMLTRLSTTAWTQEFGGDGFICVQAGAVSCMNVGDKQFMAFVASGWISSPVIIESVDGLVAPPQCFPDRHGVAPEDCF
jgi:hypothetical protein